MVFETVAEFLEAAEPADEGVEGVLGVGRAGVGYDEYPGWADGLLVESELWFELKSFGVPRVVAVDHEALEADNKRLALQELSLEDGRTASVVFGAKGGGLSGGTLYEVGEADAEVCEPVVVFHGHGSRHEAGLVEGPPEAVSGVGEVVAALDGDLGGV